MPIPAFSNDVLPPHTSDPRRREQLSPFPCTTAELCQRFATSPERLTILDGFLRFRELLDMALHPVLTVEWFFEVRRSIHGGLISEPKEERTSQGRLGNDVTHAQALEMIHLTDSPCVATVHRTLVKTRSRMLRTRHELFGLRKA